MTVQIGLPPNVVDYDTTGRTMYIPTNMPVQGKLPEDDSITFEMSAFDHQNALSPSNCWEKLISAINQLYQSSNALIVKHLPYVR